MNAVGELDEGNLHVQFDEGREETRVVPGASRLLYPLEWDRLVLRRLGQLKR